MAVAELDPESVFSRPLRLAAELRGASEAHLFDDAHVLVRLEEEFLNNSDAREAFLCIVNQVVRFCPNVGINVSDPDLIEAACRIAARVHGDAHGVQVADIREASRFAALVNVGTEILEDLPSVTVNSTGWVARVGAPGFGIKSLPWLFGAPNPIGAVAAACVGAAGAFLFLVGRRLVARPSEISLFDQQVGPPGTLSAGPELPATPVELDAFLVGCGAVTNGWAYAVKLLPITGHIEAIDRQALRVENLGPYVAAGREWLNRPKAEMIAALLGPAIAVNWKAEEWELFKIRLGYGLSVPPLVVGGLDNVETRHSVQRLWPELLIDMAAGGLTSQVILKPRRSDGICLLRALDRPPGEIGWAERAARNTGLSVERILEGATTTITDADVARASEGTRAALDQARQQGQLVCGRVTEQNLRFEGRDANFAPAVSFVTGFSGVLGAAATMKWLMGYREEFACHFQESFDSGRARTIKMKCNSDCECQAATIRL